MKINQIRVGQLLVNGGQEEMYPVVNSVSDFSKVSYSFIQSF